MQSGDLQIVQCNLQIAQIQQMRPTTTLLLIVGFILNDIQCFLLSYNMGSIADYTLPGLSSKTFLFSQSIGKTIFFLG